jgi:hypothetical protein
MKNFILTFSFALLAVLSVGRPALAQTQQYQLLAPIPLTGANSAPTQSFDVTTLATTYLPGMIKLVIGLAGGLAVVMIVVGGLRYITSATGMGKSDGKDMIFNAIIGLLLAISAYTILYTINPNLVNLSFAGLVPVTAGPALITATSPTGTIASTPTLPCNNCVSTGFAFNSKGVAPQGSTNGACLYPGPCMVNATLAGELNNLANNAGASGISWQVTEMWPPTVPHISDCHNNGTCVDASLGGTPTNSTLVTFFKDIEASGLGSYEYEVCPSTSPRLAQLQADTADFGKLQVKFTCETTTTGENVHINMGSS